VIENISLKKNLIVLNDLRATPVLACIKLFYLVDESTFIAHESIFENREYADYTPRLWKHLLKYLLIIFFRLKLIKSSINDSNDVDVDMGLQSSLISITEDSNASKDTYPEVFSQLSKLVLGAKDVISFIQLNKFSNIYLFNGRTASSYLITKHALKSNINIFYIEYAGHANGFRLFPVPPHASKRIGALLLNYYRYGVYCSSQISKASEMLVKEKLNSSYAKANKLDVNSSYDICIFLGSDFEYTAVDEEICGVKWNGNIEFCKSVIKKYGLEKSYVVRCHPNSETDSNWVRLLVQLRHFLESTGAKIDLIGPNDKIDSHKLIKKSSLIVTDLSTISLDAIILNKPVDIFGNTDINLIYNNSWMRELSGKNLNKKIIEPFSLVHNFLVFRFTKLDKFFWIIMFYIHRGFEKYAKRT
jgi:hypothetical protein